MNPTLKPDYRSVLIELRVLERLADLKPMVIGTQPLRIAIDDSDIDIACQCNSLSEFKQKAQEEFGEEANFICGEVNARDQQAMCASFLYQSWSIELFCQTMPVEDQWGVRHYIVEKRLLRLAPRLRQHILRLKHAGLKTEPAFASVFRLQGDPYEAVLRLEHKTDRELIELIEEVGVS